MESPSLPLFYSRQMTSTYIVVVISRWGSRVPRTHGKGRASERERGDFDPRPLYSTTTKYLERQDRVEVGLVSCLGTCYMGSNSRLVGKTAKQADRQTGSQSVAAPARQVCR
jgi:hypothetical protein